MKTTTATRPNFRTNADQVVSFHGHELHTVKYLGKCPVSGVRLYDMPESSFLEHTPKTFVAAEYDMSGPDMLASWLECNNSSKVYEAALSLAKKNWLPLPASVGPVTKVRVSASVYFDKANGNPYFQAEVYANGVKVAVLPRQYGNDSQIKYEAFDTLDKAGFITLEKFGNGSNEGPQRWADRTGNTFTASIYKATYNEFYNRGNYRN